MSPTVGWFDTSPRKTGTDEWLNRFATEDFVAEDFAANTYHSPQSPVYDEQEPMIEPVEIEIAQQTRNGST